MYNPSSMFVVSYPVGARGEKPQRGGGREASGSSSRLSSASEDFLRMSEPNRTQPKQHSGRYSCCWSLNVTATFMKLGVFLTFGMLRKLYPRRYSPLIKPRLDLVRLKDTCFRWAVSGSSLKSLSDMRGYSPQACVHVAGLSLKCCTQPLSNIYRR